MIKIIITLASTTVLSTASALCQSDTANKSPEKQLKTVVEKLKKNEVEGLNERSLITNTFFIEHSCKL